MVYLTVNDVTAGESKFYNDIQPITLSGNQPEVMNAIEDAFVDGGDNWTIETVSVDDGELKGTVQTPLLGFKDDFWVTITEDNSGTNSSDWIVKARSASRIGKGDFGKNADNLRTFYENLRDYQSNN